MDTPSVSWGPRTVEEIFKDYTGRRAGVLRALTHDVDEFYSLCDPAKENLCLFGYPNGTWEVALPAEEVPLEIPEPSLGINFARDGMDKKHWMSLVAAHTDAWLLYVAFYYGARVDRNGRKRLFSLINDLPTVFEVVTEWKPTKHKATMHRGSKSITGTKRPTNGQSKSNVKPYSHGDEEDEDEHGETLCGTCGVNDGTENQFWIGCDVCEKWFHGKCVKITPAMAESMKQYKCLPCSTESSR